MQSEGISYSGCTPQTYSVAVLYSKGECIEHMDFISRRFQDFAKKPTLFSRFKPRKGFYSGSIFIFFISFILHFISFSSVNVVFGVKSTLSLAFGMPLYYKIYDNNFSIPSILQ